MKKIKNYTILVAIILLLIIMIILIYFYINPFFKVEDRSENIKKRTREGYPVMGWIKVQGTNIDYPILYAHDDNYDLENTDIGYAWTNSSSLKIQDRVIVLGHNIRNVSSQPLINEKTFNNFENLPSFLYYDFVKDNKYIQYSVKNNNYIYKIYSVAMTESSQFSHDPSPTKEDKKEYISQAKKDSYFDFDIDVDENDKLITLSTCTRFFGNSDKIIKIEGRLLRNNERTKNYKVTKKSNYTEIEETMKGDVENGGKV